MNESNKIDQKVLIRLIDRLNSYPVGLPDAPEIREFLEIFLSPDEARLASLFPLKEATTEEMAGRAVCSAKETCVPRKEARQYEDEDQGLVKGIFYNFKTVPCY